ncbi:hypothetical protein [Clostridium sp. OS1-26]|uniref:hypothetical protein n=1 Tax=Clostridium sp. OS1-26 TaxID=3070681 RepID=UPI0027E1E170|nr:hypothetical protein [Clostridium sp. OS1-26]WML33209.1 hypothetical protein RCG18_17885 [Clostridium sp. OS1-26]
MANKAISNNAQATEKVLRLGIITVLKNNKTRLKYKGVLLIFFLLFIIKTSEYFS